MSIATLTNSLSVDYTDQFMICEYESEVIGADSTGLIEIVLPGKALNQASYRNIPDVTTTGKSYAIEFIQLSISCDSGNFDAHIFNRNNVTSLNTIYEILRYLNQNMLILDKQNEPFVVRNRDTTLTNKLYLFINNHDSIPTGTIRVELVYIPIQSREF